MTIYTAGYEGLAIEAFIALLQKAQINKVLDVREYPLSRKPGFSKKAFSECLSAAGIDYEHAPPLGCPKPIRSRYKEDGNWISYARDFRTYIGTQEIVLRNLMADAEVQRICMVCYEADANYCHRSLIAEAAKQLDESVDVKHLPLKIEAFADLLQSVA